MKFYNHRDKTYIKEEIKLPSEDEIEQINIISTDMRTFLFIKKSIIFYKISTKKFVQMNFIHSQDFVNATFYNRNYLCVFETLDLQKYEDILKAYTYKEILEDIKENFTILQVEEVRPPDIKC